MNNPVSKGQKAAILGVAALGTTALLGGLLLNPASATDPTNGTGSSVVGMHEGRGGHGRGHGIYGQNIIGKLLQSERVVKNADGTFSTQREQIGTVTAVDATTITVESTNGVVVTYTPGAAVISREHATATLADFVVGDHVRISGTVVDGALTVTELNGDSAETWAAREADRAAHEAAEAAGTEVAPPADGDVHVEGDMGGGRHGGGHGRGMGDHVEGTEPGAGKGDHVDGPHAGRGQVVSSEGVFEKTDGTFVTVREQFGTASATDGTSLTVLSEDGTSVSYTPGSATVTRDGVAATLADIVVGDYIRISGEVVDGNLTVSTVDVMSAEAWAAREAAHAAHEAAEGVAPSATPSATTASTTVKQTAAQKVAAKKLAAKKAAAKKAAAKKLAAKKAAAKKAAAKKAAAKKVNA